MSAIKDGRMPVVIGGKMYHMLFTLNAMDEVEDRIGSVDNLPDVLNGCGRMKVIKWLFALLLNEGMDENEEPLTEKQVGKMIHTGNLHDVQEAIYRAFAHGSQGTTDVPEQSGDGEENDDEGEDNGAKNAQPGEVE